MDTINVDILTKFDADIAPFFFEYHQNRPTLCGSIVLIMIASTCKHLQEYFRKINYVFEEHDIRVEHFNLSMWLKLDPFNPWSKIKGGMHRTLQCLLDRQYLGNKYVNCELVLCDNTENTDKIRFTIDVSLTQSAKTKPRTVRLAIWCSGSMLVSNTYMNLCAA